jgi:hypothetical protein
VGELIRYATSQEKILLVIGIVATIITGFVWPVFLKIFGDIIDVINPKAKDLDKMVDDATSLCYILFTTGTLAFGIFVISRYSF